MKPTEFERNLDKYAEVVVKVGLNLQPGQRLQIGVPLAGVSGTPIELVPLVRLIVTKAYQIGVRFVDVMWDDYQIRRIRFEHAPRDSFEEYHTWRAEAALQAARDGDAVLFIYAENPDLLNDQDTNLVSSAHQASLKHMIPFSTLRGKNTMNCVIISAPVDGWAGKIFPDVPAGERKEIFWDTLFDICRVKQPDPVSAWQDHIEQLANYSDYLNHKQYSSMKLTGPGTDLKLGLPRGHIWRSARMASQNGIDFTANIPTEEVFTMPHKDATEGFVSSTKPLSAGGSLIEDFCLTFASGRVVKAAARAGEPRLKKLLDTDEGARQLGEIALVPHSSPISQSGLLFYNTLFDENAASHIALGRALRFNIQDGETISDEDLAALGGNQSLIHLDFMVGSGEMDVDGITADGAIEPVMRDGEWAFEV
jgi:aminopeptidase